MAVYILPQMLTTMAADLKKCVAAFTTEAAKTARDCAILEEEFVSRSRMVMELKTSMQNAAKLLDLLERPAFLPDLTELLKTEHSALQTMHQKLRDARSVVEGQQARHSRPVGTLQQLVECFQRRQTPTTSGALRCLGGMPSLEAPSRQTHTWG
jgi:hypothetical protein